MNIQIFGTSKCFDTKKAQRYFKERRIKFQFVDLSKFNLSKGELRAIKTALRCKADELLDPKAKGDEAALFGYLASEEAKDEKLLEHGELLRTPIVRNGKKATVGYCPDVWKAWENE